MKKILLFALMTLSLNAFAQSQRRVLVEEFTNASCGPCASQNPAFNTLLANNLNKTIQIKYQTVWPGTDPMNAQNQAEVANRVRRYSVSGVPQAVIDGDTNKPAGASYLGAPANLTQAGINTEYAIPAPLSITATYNYNTATDSITSVVTITNTTMSTLNASAANNLKLEFALLEMNINYASAPGTNGETDFFYIMRKMYPDTNGTQLPDVINAGQALTFNFKVKAPSYIYKKEQMCIVAFVQDFGTNAVHQAAIGYPANTVDISVTDNSTQTGGLCAATINPSITITNKGTNAITSGTAGYKTNGAAGYSQPWTGNLAPGASTSITMPVINGVAGVNAYDLFFNNVNSGAVDIMEANNITDTRVTAIVGTTPNFVEDFESKVLGDQYTAISIFTPLSLASSVVDKSVNTAVTQNLGGFGLSNKSYRFNFFRIQTGRPSLTFYKTDINGKGFNGIAFDYAYNHYIENGQSFYDTMTVRVSADCGATWTEIWNVDGEALRTSTLVPTNANFYPQTNEWKNVVAPLPSSMLNASELIIQFQGRSGWGNNAYVDNIQLSNAVSIANTSKDVNVNVYPNPVSDILNIEAKDLSSATTQVSILDAVGKIVYTTNYNSSTFNNQINVNQLANGIYQVRIVNGANNTNKTICIKH